MYTTLIILDLCSRQCCRLCIPLLLNTPHHVAHESLRDNKIVQLPTGGETVHPTASVGATGRIG